VKAIFKVTLSILFCISSIFSQGIVFNEVMSSNVTTLIDEDGEYPDWIEVYNSSDAVINLDGYGISDDESDPFKWTFPDVSLDMHQFMVLFASGKDRKFWANHWETVINWGDIWKYRLGDSEPLSNWREIDFDDSSWSSGVTSIGYGDDDDATVIPSNTISFYIRKIFTVDDLNNIVCAILHVDYDDAFIAYINGIEVARANITGSNPPYNQSADWYTEPKICYGEPPEKFILENIQNLLVTGDNVLAIQVHNHGTNSSDLTIIPFLTLGMNEAPPDPHGAPEILQLPLSFLHTNFKISSNGETLIIVDKSGQIVNQIETGQIPADISHGRYPDGEDNWFFFEEATPGGMNNTQGYQGVAESPQFSQPGGFYSSSLNIEISAESSNAVICYTTDGSEPTEASNLFDNILNINSTTVLRARVFETGNLPSKVITQTYFINEDHNLPVISISSDPNNFWDDQTGIYIMGNNANSEFPYFGANFWEDWERPVHLELFEQDGTLGFSIDAGVKIFGGWSRAFSQKSLAIYARGGYGYSEINYQIFTDRTIDKFQAFVLRNSGNDWDHSMFRDGMMQSLVNDFNIETQAYKPCVVYINGEYWGIQNIREKINEHYIASHFDIDPNNIDLLENQGNPIIGDAENYNMLIDYIASHDLSIPQNYEYVKTQMDMENFIDYNVAQIYFDNTDWPGNNVKLWRPKSSEGKWRWILFDTDFGFGLYNDYAYNHNTLEFATDPGGPDWPNPPWSTLLLRKLLENEEFKNGFINRFADYLNTTFQSDKVLQMISSIKNIIDPEMGRHYDRWRNDLWWSSINNWNNHVQVLRNFALYRVAFIRAHILNKFNIDGLAFVSLDISPQYSGRIKINTLMLEKYPWNGHYFKGIPIELTAFPNEVYRFDKWTGLSSPNSNSSVIIDLSEDLNLAAVFIEDSSSQNEIVINEINYNSSNDFNPEDWIELYNNSGSTVNLSSWLFKDSEDDHIFTFPDSIFLESSGYLVLCRDTMAFSNLFPEVRNYLGDFDFGLNNGGELIRLYDSSGNMVDSLTYDDESPWPTEPDGNGPTLSLKSPESDNALAENWGTSIDYGTPGRKNDLVEIKDYQDQMPNDFFLGQNFPNPFNCNTMISFQIPRTEEVTINIYDINGRKVETLFNGKLNSGYYKVNWSTKNSTPSGIYFYHVQAGSEFNKSKKMILIK